VEASLLPPGAAVLDLVYRPGETKLVRDARALGHPACDGREMLLEQGALAFVQWFGCAPDKTVMRNALEHAMMLG
jgi:shikimate dehydrogenase